MIKYKIRTQNGLILDTMMKEPSRWFLASEFCGGSKDCPFIGYKAPTRIAEMQCVGILISRWSSRTTALGDKLKEYRINHSFYKFNNYNNFVTIVKVDREQMQLI